MVGSDFINLKMSKESDLDVKPQNNYNYGILLTGGVAGLKVISDTIGSLFRKNTPNYLETTDETGAVEFSSNVNPPPKTKPGFFKNSWDYLGCTFREWFSEQTPECAAFAERAKPYG